MVVVLVIALAITGCGRTPRQTYPTEKEIGQSETYPDLGPPHIGDEAPDFELPGRDARTLRLSSLKGSPILLHFTASWCPYCDAEIEGLDKVAKDYSQRGVKVLLVDLQEKDPAWQAFQSRVPKSIVLLRDLNGEVGANYAPPKAFPSFKNRTEVVLAASVIIDREGRIRFFKLVDTAGGSTGFDVELRTVRTALDKLLDQGSMPVQSSEPFQPQRPENILQLKPNTPSLKPGEKGELMLELKIAEGYHIMSDKPSAPNYIPTTVNILPDTRANGIIVDEPRYPPPAVYRFLDKEISTFLGTFSIRLPFTLSADALPGKHIVKGTLRYQACTNTLCLFPREIPFEAPVEVMSR
jgi:peroxiredoxin